MTAEKSCGLTPCCARFRRILSAPIDSMAEISYSWIGQFCVDCIEIAHVSWPSRQWQSLSSFGVLEIRSSIALYWSLFLKSEQSSKRIYSETVIRLFKWTEFRGNLWLELPCRSIRRRILRWPQRLQVISAEQQDGCLLYNKNLRSHATLFQHT